MKKLTGARSLTRFLSVTIMASVLVSVRKVIALYSESFGTRKVLDFSLKTDSSPTHD